ncbi:MAG TPA: cell wall-binding repeat-containing protein [Nakamurella multipartita]|nr:cell wall-binding repeat-containing protein [Nakamurella multipartita]
MKRTIWRSSLVAATVGALAISMAPGAFADDPIDDDTNPAPSLNVPASVDTWRIAGNTRIQTAIEAAEVRNDWGRGPVTAIFECNPSGIGYDQTTAPGNYEIGVPVSFQLPDGNGGFIEQTCTPTVVDTLIKDVIIARDDDYPDALAAGPMADVVNAPILLNPTDELNSDVEDYLAGQAPTAGLYVVHLLGGTAALSLTVQNEIAALGPNVVIVRHQGADRYQTAVGIANWTIFNQIINWLLDDAPIDDIPTFGNVYLATGTNYPDALASGAGAANNSGVVLLTKGDAFDVNPSGYSFTYDYIVDLPTTILSFLEPIFGPEFPLNTPEVFAVGGPAVTAAEGSLGSILAGTYAGVNRYETATLLAEGTFTEPFAGKDYFAVASGTNYPDGVVAGGFIANLDGPLLLSDPTDLYKAFGDDEGNPYTADYLQENANNSDLVFVFGGTDSLNQNVQSQIEEVLNF